MRLKFAMQYFAVFVFALAASTYLSYPIWAAATAPTAVQAAVDFTPILDQVLSFVALALAAAVGVITKFGVSWFTSVTRVNDARLEAMLAAQVNDILMKAIDYAMAWAKTQVADPNSPFKAVEFNNFFVEKAVEYAIQAMSGSGSHGLMNFFGLSRDRIADMIRARLDPYTAEPVADSGAIKPNEAALIPAPNV